MEFDKPAQMYMEDLEKAFNKVKLKDALWILQEKERPVEIIDLIKDICRK